MNTVVQTAGFVLVAMGLVVAVVVLVVTRRPPLALACGFELWLAAGLLRLSLPATAASLGTAAIVVVLRRTLSRALRTADASRSLR